jgi:hypothetical protein
MSLYERADWTLFRNINTLGQKAGVPTARLTGLIVKELVDNALDVGANVTLTGSHGSYVITDDGDGIPGSDDDVARLFSINRPLLSSKILRLPTRGALGNGLRVVAGGVLSTNGSLVVETRGRKLRLLPQEDGSTVAVNEGVSTVKGTRISLTLGGILAAQEGTGLADVAIKMRGESRYEGKSSPWWYDSDSIWEMIQAGGLTYGNLLDIFGVRSNVDRNVKIESLEQSDVMFERLRNSIAAPNATKLGCVGEKALPRQGYVLKRTQMTVAPGRGKFSAVIPVVVEVWANKAEAANVDILVNRTMVCAKVSAGQHGGREGKMWITGCGLNHYFKTGKTPLNVAICVTTPHMPIQTDGKEPNLLPLFDTISAAIESVARKVKAQNQTVTGRTASKRDLIIECLDDAISHASSNGKLRFSIRNLLYAIRPLLLNFGIEEPGYNYFCQVIGSYEQDNGEIPGMYRDARGVLIHPHTRERIELGTLAVEKYRRPDWLFKRIIYVEKQGFFPLLEDVKWGERWDCALLSSQGQATRAVKDMLDLIGDTEEEITIFCVHDADGYGTIIHQALVEGTLAREGRRVKVINLGLEPWEAERMDLQSEKVESERGVPVARYVEEYDDRRGTNWKGFLQTGRYELNAMTSEQFIEWLDAKMEENGLSQKLIPPRAVLQGAFTENVTDRIRAGLTEKAVRDARVEERTATFAECMMVPYELDRKVEKLLEKTPTDPWKVSVGTLANGEADSILRMMEGI